MADLLLAQFWERDWGDEAIFAEGVLQHVRRPPPDHDPMVSPPPILQAKTVRKQVVRRPAATAQEEPNPRILTRKVTEVMDTRGVGFTFRLARDAWTPDFYIKRMQWWKAGTRWHCEWEWTPYDRTAWHDLCSKGQAPSDVDAFDRVMKAQARGLPLEILLHMVHKSRHPRIQRKDNDTLATFALVCSSWYDLCAPSLYHTIAVQTFRAKDFLDCIRAPHSRIPRYTKTVHVRGTHSWALYARLSGYLPNVVMVHCSDLSISRLDPASLGSYPPSCPRISGGLLRRLEHVKNIRLSYCRFDSSLHLLRLLGSFPALKYATLTGISCKSSFVAPPTNVTPSRLNYIHTLDCHPLWPLALSWRWPHPSADASASGFPGLLDFEMRLVTDLVQSVQLHNDVDLFLDGSPTDLSVWTAWVMSADVHLEFHARLVEDGAPRIRRSVTAHIISAVLRMRTDHVDNALETLFVGGTEGLGRMCDALSQLPHLETFVLEMQNSDAGSAVSTELEKQAISSRLQKRTCEMAQSQALSGKLNGRRATSLPISPFWHLARHRHDRMAWLVAAAPIKETVLENSVSSNV